MRSHNWTETLSRNDDSSILSNETISIVNMHFMRRQMQEKCSAHNDDHRYLCNFTWLIYSYRSCYIRTRTSLASPLSPAWNSIVGFLESIYAKKWKCVSVQNSISVWPPFAGLCRLCVYCDRKCSKRNEAQPFEIENNASIEFYMKRFPLIGIQLLATLWPF